MAQVWRVPDLTRFDVTTEMPEPVPLHGMAWTLDPASMPLPQSDMADDTDRDVGPCRGDVCPARLTPPVFVSGLIEKQAKVRTYKHVQKPGRKRG